MSIEALAVVFPEQGQIELQEIALPDPTDDDLLIRTEYSGISVGTERWALEGYRPEVVYPLVTGYLGIGVVEAVGSQVEDFTRGDRVHFKQTKLPEPYNLNWMGAHVSRAVVGSRADMAVTMPAEVEGPTATMVGLAGVSIRGTNMMKVRLHDTALVTGQGMIGQAAAQILRARGARVMTTDLMPTRVRLSEEWSADLALNVAEQDLAEAASQFAPEGFDLIVDTTGSNEVVNQLWPLLKGLGQFLLQGWYPGQVSFNFQEVHQYRPTIYVTCSHDLGDIRLAAELEAQGSLHLAPLVTHNLPYQQAPEAFRALLQQGKEEFLGVVFDWREA